MSDFIQGQRWVVDSEPELGLGTVLSSDVRTVTLFFQRSEEERRYAIKGAPLTRIHFDRGETIETVEGDSFTVVECLDHNGLFIYDCGDDRLIPESALSANIDLNSPLNRLITSQLDHPKWFRIRRQLQAGIQKVWQHNLNGLLGARAGLLAHQLYIAKEATKLKQTRVLLSDEVGLGKTIEAGYIISRLLRLERARNVIIFVPEALKVQWMVELLRRFNLTPHLWQKGDELNESSITIASHQSLSDLESFLQLSQHGFDTVIVDEAHHIEYNLDAPSAAYQSLEDFAEQAQHLILLSATPEQLGLEGHFGRLRLLDPVKFNDLQHYLQQEQDYLDLTDTINQLQTNNELDVAIKNRLSDQYAINCSQTNEQIIEELVDRFGTGRGIYRNTRHAVEGFPKRQLQAVQLEGDDAFKSKLHWLSTWLDQQDKQDKHLLICHDLESVLAIEKFLWEQKGLSCAVFHEQMSLIERDRSAAFFADDEQGARIMLCSEIGSEGRNFQFCHNLICFDLPDSPDLLEQRIGRLDRIGQLQDVTIWIPSINGSEEQLKCRWFDQAINCIVQCNPAAASVHTSLYESFLQATDEPSRQQISQDARQLSDQLLEEIQQGRDKLLEISSCRQPIANQLVDNIALFEQDSPQAILELAFDVLNVHFEDLDNGRFSLQPGDNMLLPFVPGVPEEGAEVTFNRDIALSRDDVRFVSWDSPIVTGLWDMLNSSEIGTATLALFPSELLPAGHILLESMYHLSIQHPLQHKIRPFLQEASVRVVNLENNAKDLADVLAEEKLQDSLTTIKPKLAREIIKSKKEDVRVLSQQADELAKQRLNAACEQAKSNAQAYYERELARLNKLQQVNASCDEDEIHQLTEEFEQILLAIKDNIRLIQSSLRLIITAPK